MSARIVPSGRNAGSAFLALFVVLAILGGFVTNASAVTALPSLSFTPESGVSMKITSFYENIPPCGYLPLRIEIKNLGDARRVWTFRSTHSQYTSSTVSFVTEVRAEPRSESTFDVLVPLVNQGERSARYSNLQISISGPGVVDGSTNFPTSGRGGNLTPYLGLGGELAVSKWGLLEDSLKKKGSRTLDGTNLDSKMMPSDWRGLAGFQIIVFTASEWRTMAPGARAALFEWVAQGGKLVIGYDGAAGASDLPVAGGFGTGEIAHWVLVDDILPRLEKALDGGSDSLGEIADRSYTWQWKLAKAIGRPESPKILLLIFVIVFAVIVGPINFLVIAPAGKRSRLFWTTPLISISASVLMGLFILLSEGLGGRGSRFVAMLSLADQNKTVIWQEQVSRTGALLGGSFVPSDTTALLLPINFSEPSGYRRDRSRAYSLAGDRWSGDWFRSRRTQGQLLAVVTSSRGQFTFGAAPDGTPTVVSTFDKEMTNLWFFDQSERLWTAPKVAPGEKVTLMRADASGFDTWLSKALSPAGALTQERVQDFAKSPRAGKFLAAVPDPIRIATLPAIRWETSEGIVFGRAKP
jgi:hypothetical protein